MSFTSGLDFQDALKRMSIEEVRRVAEGFSGPLARIFGLDELKRRGEMIAEAKADEAEMEMKQPPMVDQYIAMSKQMMGQPPSMPPAMPPSMPAPPQQGIGSMMPPQAPMGPALIPGGGAPAHGMPNGEMPPANTPGGVGPGGGMPNRGSSGTFFWGGILIGIPLI